MDGKGETEVDLIVVVQRDHRAIEALMARVEGTDGGASRDQFFAELVQKLEVHETAEAEIVHALVGDLGAEDLAGDLLMEEGMARHALANLDASAPDFSQRFASFKEDVLTHARHEEREEHPSLRARASRDVLVRMGERFEAASETSLRGASNGH
jgi:hypothetical protein